jgi:hypothetical protein
MRGECVRSKRQLGVTLRFFVPEGVSRQLDKLLRRQREEFARSAAGTNPFFFTTAHPRTSFTELPECRGQNF